ncbi:MAG: membrane dipeptidase [Phaeodactylibacter sp.]|nr:membrane dipeptidase [Phaeodactylibacter sp.]MCB9274394.1 membrane dipeptidase [Lewinellaceae bacterium]
MNHYFDLHLHPSTKPFLSHYDPARRVSCWETVDHPLSIIRSQCSLSQMKEGRIRLAVAALYPMERPMTSSFLIEHVAPLITILDGKMMDFPTYANYFNLVFEEIEHLRKAQRAGQGHAMKILNNLDEMDPDALNLILALEGGHALESFNTSIHDNLRTIKTGPFRFLYLTLVHLTQYPLATHAYGMKLIKDNDQFKPAGFGLSDMGKAIIDLAYDESAGRRLLIDIKHMSLAARHHFYQYRKEKGYEHIPIMATHMGVTGISKDPRQIARFFSRAVIRKNGFIEVNYERPHGIGSGLFNKTNFNPWSINLFDEEIPVILDSGGLIGINMDQRILGCQAVQGEFFSEDDFSYILSGYRDKENKDWPVAAVEGEFSDEQEEARELNERKHLRHFCNNILHIVKVGGERAWKQICMGSDFDGLIDPANHCTSSAAFPKLEESLADMLPRMMEEDRGHDYDASHIEQKVRGIMYDNALSFLQQHFS